VRTMIGLESSYLYIYASTPQAISMPMPDAVDHGCRHDLRLSRLLYFTCIACDYVGLMSEPCSVIMDS
jgi:hypothetical protein